MKAEKTAVEGAIRRYTFKLYPNKAQSEALDRIRKLHGVFYNAALQERADAYRLAGKTLTAFDQGKSIKFIRADDPEYEAISADSMNFTLQRLDLAFKAFFRRAKAGAGYQSGFPRYKRSVDYPGFTFRPRGGWRFDYRPNAKSGKTYIKGVPGNITWRGRFPTFPYSMKTGTVMFRSGEWMLSVVVDLPVIMTPESSLSGEVEFGLIDSFAHVRCANGGQAAGPEETVFAAADGRIILQTEGVTGKRSTSPDVCGETFGQRLPRARRGRSTSPDVCGETFGSICSTASNALSTSPDVCGETLGVAPRLYLQVVPSDPDICGDALGILRTRAPGSTGSGASAGNSRNATIGKKKTIGSFAWRAEKQTMAKTAARTARQRKEGLHVWTTRLACRFEKLRIISPPLTEAISSGKGWVKEPGAMVSFKAFLNQRIAAMAPGMAISMLEYKLAQRGGSCEIITNTEAEIMKGNDIVIAAKEVRKLRRTANARRSG